jgi:oxalate decarboxylase/phosphoglucose isomerase-like protein (cupin superfamily)
MTELKIRIVEDHELYQIGVLELLGSHPDRRLAPSIDHGGAVHLNIMQPGARSGNHYHRELQEFFINPGPASLVLHLRNPKTGEVITLDIPPASTEDVRAYRAKTGVPHIVENNASHTMTVIIVVDEDRPEDVCPSKVYDDKS